MRHFFGLLLILLFSVQALPVKEMGKLLGKIQNTEEVQTDDIADDSNNDGLNVKDMKFAESKFFSHTLGAALYIRFSPTSCAIRFPDGNDVLPSIHVDDIPSPPPDQFS